MVRRSDKEDALKRNAGDDDLGDLIRCGLQDSFSRVEPPADAWPKILQRVQAMDVPVQQLPARRRWSFSFAPFAQAVVASALLLAFGLGVDRDVTTPSRKIQTPVTPSAQGMEWSQGLPKDVMRGYMLARAEPEPPTRGRPGGMRP